MSNKKAKLNTDEQEAPAAKGATLHVYTFPDGTKVEATSLKEAYKIFEQKHSK